MKRVISLIFVFILIFSSGMTVLANPTDSFAHDETASGSVEPVLTQDMYYATKLITAQSLGLKNRLAGVNDFCTDNDGKVYLLVADSSEIVVLNPDYTLDRAMTLADKSGENLDFKGALGIFVDNKKNIYVCDTENFRVLIVNQSGEVIDIWEKPDSNLYPDDLLFQPSKITITEKGYTYILILGGYYGALLYSPQHEFLGFYGSNTVKATALDTLSYLWDRLTQTDAKKAVSAKKLPFSFVDLCLDSDDYVLTCTEASPEEKENGTGQIRKLSPTGENIMFKRQTDGTSLSADDINFVEKKVTEKFGKLMKQNIVSIDVDENDFIYALDSQKGLIYIYDAECNLLCGFGGGYDKAKRLGVFDSALSLCICGTDVLVYDSDNKCITVFERTEYGDMLVKAQSAYLDGEYEAAKPLWEEINRRDKSCQLAYRGLAIAYLSEGKYEKALEYAKNGLDYTVYDLAWKAIRNNFILDHFVLLFSIAIVVVGGIIAFVVVAKKKRLVIIKNQYVKTALSSTVHPFKAFDEIKSKQMGSVIIAFVILLLYYLSNVFEAVGSGFLATHVVIYRYNTIYTLIKTVGIVLLWTICNWLISSSFEGKGRFKDVLVATTYSLIPLIVFTYIKVILSHVLSLSGLRIVDAIGVVVLIITFFILCIAVMTVHEFDFFKFLITAIVSVLFMILVAFVIFVVIILLQQVGNFFTSLFSEILYR